MKTKTISTTEFYRNASKALSFVKDGGTLYLGYKNLKEPIAVLTSYDEYNSNLKSLTNPTKKKDVKKGGSLYDKYKDMIMQAPEYSNSTEYIRKMRDNNE